MMTEDRRNALRAQGRGPRLSPGHPAGVLDLAESGRAVRSVPADRRPVGLPTRAAAILPYGGVACHAYGELHFPELDPPRLEAAWWSLVLRHDMLRAVFDSDGSQRVLAGVRRYSIRVADFRGGEPSGPRRGSKASGTKWIIGSPSRTAGHCSTSGSHSVMAGATLHVSIDFLIADYVEYPPASSTN